MGSVITWLMGNWVTIIGVAGTVVMGASIIVKAIAPLTSSQKDDEVATWLDKVYKWLSSIALNPPLPPILPTASEKKAMVVRARELENAKRALALRSAPPK